MKRTKTVSAFDRDALMDKEQRLAERAFKNCGSKKRLRDGFKLADKTRELNAREEDLDGRDEVLNALKGPRDSWQELAEPVKRLRSSGEEAMWKL